MKKIEYKFCGLKPEMVHTEKRYSKEGKCISEKLKLKYVINTTDLNKYKELLELKTIIINDIEFKLEKYEYMCFTNVYLTER